MKQVKILRSMRNFQEGELAITTNKPAFQSIYYDTWFYLVVPLDKKLCALTGNCEICNLICGAFYKPEEIEDV